MSKYKRFTPAGAWNHHLWKEAGIGKFCPFRFLVRDLEWKRRGII